MPRSSPCPRFSTSVSSRYQPTATHSRSTLPSPSGSSLAPNVTRSANGTSRVNHGALAATEHHASSGYHSGPNTPTGPQAYHGARGKNRPSPTLMQHRILSSGKMLIYLRDTTQVNNTVIEFRDNLKGPLGFDLEYRPNFIKGRPLNRTALVQLASESVTLLVQVSAMSEFPPTIRNIIEDPTIIKAGVGIRGDADKLWKDFGINLASCLELGYLARAVDKQWANSRGLISLVRLVKAYEDRDLRKPKHIQMSNWELPLTEEQQDYAADDASSALTVLQKLYAILPYVDPVPAKALYLF